jgi:enoyl-CoA hydratase
MVTGADAVLVDRQDGVLTITINRPRQRNAINRAVAEGIASALEALDGDPELSVGVLTGAGGTFSAGMDLKAFLAGEMPTVPGRGLGGMTRAMVRKPLVAAVEGWALGGGFELALACDLIVAAQDARFGFPEVKRGLIPAEGGAIRLPRRLPHHIAMQVLLTGDPLPAVTAERFGLVNQLVAAGATLQAARELAAGVAGNAPLALAAVKQVVRLSDGVDEETAFARQDPLIAELARSEDVREGATAFTERRPPAWRGR